MTPKNYPILPLLPDSQPDHIYRGLDPRPATDLELWQGHPPTISGPRPSGCAALDRFTALVHRHLHACTIPALARQLSVTPQDLNTLVRTLTGLNARQWQERYVMLAARELLSRPGLPVQDVCRRLGYSRNGLHQLMLRNPDAAPAAVRRRKRSR